MLKVWFKFGVLFILELYLTFLIIRSCLVTYNAVTSSIEISLDGPIDATLKKPPIDFFLAQTPYWISELHDSEIISDNHLRYFSYNCYHYLQFHAILPDYQNEILKWC